MVFLFEDWICFNSLKLCLEVIDSITMSAAIGATSGIRKIITIVSGFFAVTAPS